MSLLLTVADATKNGEADAASGTDPLLLALFSVGGVVFTAVVGLIAAAIQSRREHEKWLRERRFEAYRTFLVHLREFEDEKKITADAKVKVADLKERLATLKKEKSAAKTPAQKAAWDARNVRFLAELDELSNAQSLKMDRLTRLSETMNEAATPFVLLGPKAVRTLAVVKPGTTLADGKRDFAALEQAMRDALGIKD